MATAAICSFLSLSVHCQPCSPPLFGRGSPALHNNKKTRAAVNYWYSIDFRRGAEELAGRADRHSGVTNAGGTFRPSQCRQSISLAHVQSAPRAVAPARNRWLGFLSRKSKNQDVFCRFMQVFIPLQLIPIFFYLLYFAKMHYNVYDIWFGQTPS